LRKKNLVSLLVTLGVVLVLGYLIYGSTTLVQAECELCVTFRGTQCRRGSGTDVAEARQAAQRAACAVMTGSMNESIACQNVVPTNVQCPPSR
jgi:hypothetical protein